ncbi:hypothetical protein EJD97_006667 [Solanum chilense]|uniref:Uncharacterized protein n=1 Tax=Solanum chilense TaxID=4083 RepID=A0A6N2ALZ3_SOLCI|nr:hypothetical protein EJD97_006667 [Solanum chilense]
MVRRHWAWHGIINLGQHTRSNDVGRGMQSSPLDTYTVGLRRVLHAIIALGINTRSDDVGPGMPLSQLERIHRVGRCRASHAFIALTQYTWSEDVRHDMPSSPLGSTHGRMTSVVHRQTWHVIIAHGHHKGWEEVGRCNVIMALCQHTWSDDFGYGRPSSNLDSIHRVGRSRAWHAIISLGKQTRSQYYDRPWLAHTVGRCWEFNSIISLWKPHMVERSQHVMLSAPFNWTHRQMTTGVACHHFPCAAHTVRRRRALDAIIGLVQQTQADNIRGCIRAWTLGTTHCQTMSRVACRHHPWIEHTIGLYRAWYAIMVLDQHTRSDDVRCGRPSSLLDSIHTVGQCLAWHAIIAVGQHTRSEDVGRGMLSSPLDCTHERTTLGMEKLSSPLAWHESMVLRPHTQLDDVESGMPSSPLGSTYDQTTSDVACYHDLWEAHTIRLRLVWHPIIALVKHTRSKNLEP